MEITLNVEGDLIGVNSSYETALIVKDGKNFLYPIKSITLELEDSPREI